MINPKYESSNIAYQFSSLLAFPPTSDSVHLPGSKDETISKIIDYFIDKIDILFKEKESQLQFLPNIPFQYENILDTIEKFNKLAKGSQSIDLKQSFNSKKRNEKLSTSLNVSSTSTISKPKLSRSTISVPSSMNMSMPKNNRLARSETKNYFSNKVNPLESIPTTSPKTKSTNKQKLNKLSSSSSNIGSSIGKTSKNQINI